jgi:hypothetical protein
MNIRKHAALATVTAAALTAGTLVIAQTAQPSPSSPRTQPISPGTPSNPSSPVTPRPTTPGSPSQPTNPSNPNNPNTPANPTNPSNPNNPPAVEPAVPATIEPPITRQPGATLNQQRLFALEPNMEAPLNDFSTRMGRLESGLMTNNDQLLRELGDARLTGDTNARLDRFASILQRSLQENRQILSELAAIRAALTGTTNGTAKPLTNPGTTTPGPTTPGTTTPTTPGTTPPAPTSPSSPRSPAGTPSTPGNPSGPPR